MGTLHTGSPSLEPKIESLPWFGTSWFTRGPSYWFRRALLSLMFLGIVAVELWILGLLLEAVRPTPNGQIVSVVILGVVVVVGVATGLWLWRRQSAGQSERVSRRAIWGGASAGAAAGVLARAGSVLGAFFIVFGAIFTVGPFAVLFLMSFTPVPSPERQARERLERWYQEHGRTVPWHERRHPRTTP
jgi:hypothetical protein